jgi:transposase
MSSVFGKCHQIWQKLSALYLAPKSRVEVLGTGWAQFGHKAQKQTGFHNKMEMMTRRAYGFRNFENYRLRVLAHCGWDGVINRV